MTDQPVYYHVHKTIRTCVFPLRKDKR